MALPRHFAQIPRFRLLYPDPSPIHPLQALTSLPTNNQPPRTQISLYAKREDHSSPLACAGNKYRKLEYLIPDILNPPPTPNSNSDSDSESSPTVNGGATRPGKVTTLVTEGAVQSNHTIQVASVAQKLGLECVAILHKGTGGGLGAAVDKDAFLRVGNVQVARLLGAQVRVLEPSPSPSCPQVQKTDPVLETLDELAADGKVPYWIPSGASLHPLGGLGYARAAFEIAAQEERASQNNEVDGSGRFDYIFVACGSGSTVGGLIAGFKLLEKQSQTTTQTQPPRKIIGILNSPTMPRSYHEERVLRFARTAGGMIGLDPEKDITMDDVCLDDRFVGTAYGVLDPKMRESLNMMAQKEGVILDPVYTAKVVRGLVHWVQTGDLERNWADRAAASSQINALFIHTGGQSALPAYADVD